MDDLKIKTDLNSQILRVWYQPKTTRSIYDVCDTNGTVLKSGELKAEGVEIDISDLECAEYLFLILDGEEVVRKRVDLENGTEIG